MYRVYPITSTRCQRREKGMMTYLHGYGEQITRPVLTFLIRGEGVNVVVDPGGSANELKPYIPFDWEDVERLESALNQRGVQAKDVGLVIQTHLHVDHCLGVKKFPHARIWVQEDELKFAKSPHPLFANYYRPELFEGVSFKIIKGDREVVPGIHVLHVPGHTPGCQAVSVQTEQGRVVISGFCSIQENFNPPTVGATQAEVITPGICTDPLQAYYSALRVKGEADFILPLHEPSLTAWSGPWPK